MESAMHDSRRYRDNAAECLLAFRDSGQPSYRKLCLSLAGSWLFLAHREEALDNLVVGYDTAEPVHPQIFASGSRQ
jgi:hypothetical protein